MENFNNDNSESDKMNVETFILEEDAHPNHTSQGHTFISSMSKHNTFGGGNIN